MKIDYSDIRDIFFDNIKKIFLNNKNFYILTNDADVFALQKIKNHKRFIDAGVCEQNLINIASGLAKKNKKVLIYGFCNFLCHRAYEQIKINIGSMNLPVAIVGIGPGFSFPYDGPTHHGIQDISNILTIPELEIYNLSDNRYADYISKNILKIKGPKYIRLEKGICSSDFKIKNMINGFEYLPNNNSYNSLIITTGFFAQLEKKILKTTKKCSLLNLLIIRKFNKKKLASIIKKYQNILIYDENTYFGGISPVINQVIIENKFIDKKIIYLTCPENLQIFKYSNDRMKILKDLNINLNDLKKKLNSLK